VPNDLRPLNRAEWLTGNDDFFSLKWLIEPEITDTNMAM